MWLQYFVPSLFRMALSPGGNYNQTEPEPRDVGAPIGVDLGKHYPNEDCIPNGLFYILGQIRYNVLGYPDTMAVGVRYPDYVTKVGQNVRLHHPNRYYCQ